MDIGALRALSLTVNFDVHGVAVTVTQPSQAAVSTRGVWVQSRSEQFPVGRDLQRVDPRRVMALRTSAVGTSVKRGTTVVAAEHGGTSKTWKVDGIEQQTAEVIRVVLVE